MVQNTEISGSNEPFRVLARKYRPSDFTTLIGQEPMVRTLSNAIDSGRLAHSFILTGVRGVGKTTTARIIARALNCAGTDGSGGPSKDPCGVCEHCVAIAEDRHVDVIEMDAASRTGVDDIRDLIDGVLYRPVSARYKIYIVDEVHMLSRNAFNALLKTLEEPPEHVKFIFATTEIRRVPVTVLSRCQRFDLRRVNFEELSKYFAEIAKLERATISRGALDLVTRAADGSVRDGLSLLDQAIARVGIGIEINEDTVREMLGVAERVHVFDLFEALINGEIAEALEHLGSMYQSGADPALIIQDLAELTHWLTRLKAIPEVTDLAPRTDHDLSRGRLVSSKLQMAVLTRTWQMLLKGLAEMRAAYSSIQAAEMVLIRIAYTADLPSPAEAVAALDKGTLIETTDRPTGSTRVHPSETTAEVAEVSQISNPSITSGPTGLALKPEHVVEIELTSVSENTLPKTFEEMVALFSINGEPLLHAYLVNNVHIVKYEIGKISLRVSEEGPRDLAKHISRCLNDWTGKAWFIEASQEDGEPTLQEKKEVSAAASYEAAIAHPLVQKTLETFPGAVVVGVKDSGNEIPLSEPYQKVSSEDKTSLRDPQSDNNNDSVSID